MVSRSQNWIRELAAGVGADVVAVFKAYLDESGIHADPKVFAMAGFIAPAETWDDWTPKWLEILSDNNIERFHAYHCNAFKGEFRQFWDNDEAKRPPKRKRRDAMVIQLLETLNDGLIFPFNTAVNVSDYEDFIKQYPKMRHELDHPYLICMQQCLVQIAVLVESVFLAPDNERILCVFDRQDRFSRKATTIFNELLERREFRGRERFDEIVFGSDRKHIPIQAADAIAFDTRQELISRYFKDAAKPRPSYYALTKRRIFDEQFWDRELFDDYLNRPAQYPPTLGERLLGR